MRIEELEIERLRIEGGLLAQDIEARVSGSFTDEGDEQKAALKVERTDRPGDEISLTSEIEFDDLSIDFALQASEAPGGLVGQMGTPLRS